MSFVHRHLRKNRVWPPTARPACSLVSWRGKPMTTKKRLTLGLSLVAACSLTAVFATPASFGAGGAASPSFTACRAAIWRTPFADGTERQRRSLGGTGDSTEWG